MKGPKKVILKDIVKEYESPNKTVFRAVDRINLEIHAGEFVTLLGPSGCGKTTTLRMIAGFETPTEGEIFLGDDCINEQTPDKRDTAMVFQSYALFPHYNVYNNISYGLRLQKLDEKEIARRVGDIITLVGLEGMEERFPNQISGGQQQRVALARALVMEPGVMLFDEPLSNLDAKLRVYMRSEIRKIQRRLGLTSIYVTHDQAEAMSLSDRIIVMNKGIIEQVGTPQEIYQHPASEFVADFIGRANFVQGVVKTANADRVSLSLLGTELSVPTPKGKSYAAGDTVTAILRPEAGRLGEQGQFEGVVITSTFMGSCQEYFIQVEDMVFNLEDTDPTTKRIYAEGEHLHVFLPPDSIHIS
ncbi:MAG: ABC transporter ATP-binding protein, partial [Angelakisella sp.]